MKSPYLHVLIQRLNYHYYFGISQAGFNGISMMTGRKISFEKIYTSYQARAVKTAQIVDEHFHSGYETVQGLEEMNLGLFEGHNWDEILSMYAEEHKQWMSNKRYNRAPNGESYQMVMERLFRALDHIFEQHDTDSDKNLLIISHGAVIMTLLSMKRDIPFEQSHTIEVENVTPIVFSIEELKEIRKKL